MRDLFSDLRDSPDHEHLHNLRPDGVFLRERDVKYVLVDITRGYGWRRTDLQEHERKKRDWYAELVTFLNIRHTVVLFPLACSYNGAIAEDTWRALMDCLEIRSKGQEFVFKNAIRAICVGFSKMVDIRHGCLNEARQAGHTSDTRHSS